MGAELVWHTRALGGLDGHISLEGLQMNAE